MPISQLIQFVPIANTFIRLCGIFSITRFFGFCKVFYDKFLSPH